VGPRSEGPERRPAQDVLDIGIRQEVGEIGVPARELEYPGDLLRPLELASQELRQPLGIDDLVGPDIDQVWGIHRFEGRS
jgi:hypothetical protein